MNIVKIKENLNKYVGRRVKIRYDLGRNKKEEAFVVIKELFDNIFLVEKEDKIIKSFSYNDVITKVVKLDFNVE